MADYLVTDTELTSIADAIRTKGGTSANLSFPTEFVSAINAIETGGGGLEYEEGIYTPTEDVSRPTITFANAHTEVPILVLFFDQTGTYHTVTNTNYGFMFFDFYKMWGYYIPWSSTNKRYEAVGTIYRTTSSSNLSTSILLTQSNSDNTIGTNSSYSRYWVTPTEFNPSSNSTSRYWRADRTYKWIAIWK